jgi:hypothetical protein
VIYSLSWAGYLRVGGVPFHRLDPVSAACLPSSASLVAIACLLPATRAKWYLPPASLSMTNLPVRCRDGWPSASFRPVRPASGSASPAGGPLEVLPDTAAERRARERADDVDPPRRRGRRAAGSRLCSALLGMAGRGCVTVASACSSFWAAVMASNPGQASWSATAVMLDSAPTRGRASASGGLKSAAQHQVQAWRWP